MKITKLTNKILKTFKPQEKRYRVYVENSPGLYLLVGTTGTITFQFRYQLRGQRREIKIGNYPARTMQNLLAEYSAFVDQVQQGIDPLTEREKQQQQAEDDPLFKDFAERFINKHVKKHLAAPTAKEYERQIRKHFIPAWGKRKVVDIQRKQIVKMVEALAESAPIQSNRNLATIKKMFSYALDVGLVTVNPASGIKRPAKETPKQRVLSMEEITTLFKTLEGLQDRDTSDLLRLIALTAQRPGEVAEMRISQLKEESADLWLELASGDTKNSEPQRIFLNDMAVQIIKARLSDMSLENYIFPARVKADKPKDKPSSFIRKDVVVQKVRRIQPTMQEQGVSKFTAHDLRRSAATGIARLGHGAVVDDILNHKKQGVTRKIYDLYDRGPEIKRALTVWGEAVGRSITGAAGADVIEIKAGNQS
ncbi:MAG: tyrosine-type recombinase/integrase [Deltaproteobacteria bacterium]|nr:tyrosine-type recombinase/integrase [Deltaproteobacteria bacterium]